MPRHPITLAVASLSVASLAAFIILVAPSMALGQDRPAPADAFDFLIGSWRGDVRIPLADGTVARQKATWSGRRILDGGAIIEEYRATGADGGVQVLGSNLRAYNEAKGGWKMYWYDALNATLTILGPAELGGVTTANGVISFRFRINNVLSRARFEEITPNRFVWHGDVSEDGGKSWRIDTITIEARRIR